MTQRICPKCGFELKNSNSYFCTNCGSKLDPVLIRVPGIEQKITKLGQKSRCYREICIKYLTSFWKNVTKFLPYKYLLAIIASLALVGLTYTVVSFNSLGRKDVNVAKNTSEHVCDGSFACGAFGQDAITNYVPHDTDVYLEGFDFNKFTELFLEVNPTFTYILTELSKLGISHFVVFGQISGGSTYWTLLAISTNDPTESIMQLFGSSQNNIYLGKIDNIFVLSTKPNVLLDIQLARDRINKNFSLNPKYATAKGKSYATGQAFIITPSNDGKKLLYSFEKRQLPGSLKTMLEKFIDANNFYLVI